MQNSNTRKLVESALMIAVATVLSVLKIADMPYGGSVTLASMLPLVILSYRNGLGWGLCSAFTYGVLQQLLGLKNLTYFSTPGSIIAIILLDYLVAFAVIGLGGMFRRTSMKQSTALVLGSAVVCLLRYACHVISGATVWAGLSIPDAAALGYSFIYNATYMVPETIVLCLSAYYLGNLLDLRRPVPARLVREEQENHVASWLNIGAGLVAFAGIVYDVVAIFAKLQDPETGEFNITLLADKWLWISVSVVTLLVVAAVVTLTLVRRKLAGKAPATDARP